MIQYLLTSLGDKQILDQIYERIMCANIKALLDSYGLNLECILNVDQVTWEALLREGFVLAHNIEELPALLQELVLEFALVQLES